MLIDELNIAGSFNISVKISDMSKRSPGFC